MIPYAEHLHDIPEILASVRQVTALADDLAGTSALSRASDASWLRASHAAFKKAYGDATVEGIADEAEARDLLRDAVNLVFRLGCAYGGADRILQGRIADALDEFKPSHRSHHGLSVGDRVEERHRSDAVAGEVIALDPDVSRATIRTDTDGSEFNVSCALCVHLPTFRSRIAPSGPSPR